MTIEQKSIKKIYAPEWLIFLGLFLYPAIIFLLLPITGYKKNTNHIMVNVNQIAFAIMLFNIFLLSRVSDFIKPSKKEDNFFRYYISFFLDVVVLLSCGAGLPAIFLMLILW